MFMKKTALSLTAAALLCLASAAHAQATRTWVSGVGDDANPCSRTAPCKTFAGAISKTAPGGEINVLDPGGFGAVTITKAITIANDGAIAGVLVSGTNAIVVSAGVNDVVTLRGLDIDGLGTGIDGIRFLSGKALHVENCQIYGFTTDGIDFEPNSLGGQLEVSDTRLSENAVGILARPAVGGSAKVSLNRVQMENNTDGFKADSTNGAMQSTIKDSVATGNSGVGIRSVTTGQVTAVMVDHTTSVNNGTGISSEGGAASTVRITNTTVTGNGTGLSPSGGAAIVSFHTNNVQGNGSDGAATSTIAQQ
jgi:Right handed beta helix region